MGTKTRAYYVPLRGFGEKRVIWVTILQLHSESSKQQSAVLPGTSGVWEGHCGKGSLETWALTWDTCSSSVLTKGKPESYRGLYLVLALLVEEDCPRTELERGLGTRGFRGWRKGERV